MKAPRLARSNTSQTFDATTSFDDLRTHDGRQRLRAQLSSQFPESYTSSLKSSPSATEMAGSNWLAVGQNAAAKSSSSSVDSTSNGSKKRATLPEQHAAIDVEQAIHLLTELKKTASPEQLVALHKALLPTRDSIISTADSTAGQRTSVIRQKSMLPAGLATRGGASDDLLKRQEDVQPVVRKKTSSPSGGHKRLQSKSSIAALDLADDAANPLPAQRAATPNDQQYFGAYRPGTLRITNGAASPEPTLRPRTGGDGVATTGMIGQDIKGLERAGSLAEAVSQWAPANATALDLPKARTQATTERKARSTLPQSKSRDPSQSRQYRSQRSQEPLQSSTPRARSREPSLSRVAQHLETKPSRPSMVASRKSSADTLLRRSIDSMTVRRSIDDGRVSPIDAPRFAQRWSHRASHISQEYTPDCDVPPSPFEDKQTSLTFAQRLSTVYDREDAENTANETPEVALSKLEGNSTLTLQGGSPVETRTGPTHMRKRSEEWTSLRTTADMLNHVTRPPLITSKTEPRPMPSKADSGYVSDASRRSMQRQLSHDPAIECTASPATYEQPGYKEIIHRPDFEADDNQSMYTLEQMLKMPSLSSAPTTPTRPDTARKHSSLFKLAGFKKSSLAASKTTLDAHSSADSLPLPNELASSSPVEAKAVKPSKRLQKRMPEDVLRRRKSQKDKAKQSALSLATRDLDAQGQSDGLELVSSPTQVSSPAAFSQPVSASRTTLPSSPLPGHGRDYSTGPSELAGDMQQPAELDTDDSMPAPRPPLVRSQSKKKSWRRSRQNTVTATTDTEDGAEARPRRSFSLGRKRDKSRRRSGSLTPKKRKSEDVPKVPSIATLSATWHESGSEESLPLYSDYGSVSRTLGGNPYDISTGMIKQGNARGAILDGLQSPHQISTSWSRTRTGGLQGMDATMASELARLKSRDVAMQNNEELYDQPRVATPKKRSQTDAPRSRNTMAAMPNAIMVEQRSLGWNARPVFQQASVESLDSASRQRPHSVAESIPSLPDIPVDAEARSVKATEYLARRHRQMQASPVLAESPSPASSLSAEHPGFSNESVADAVAKAVEARRAKHAERVKQGQREGRLHPATSRADSDTSSSSGQVSLQIHGVDERPYSAASASILIGVGSERGEEGERQEAHDAEPTVWKRQAQLWRQKRESIRQSPGKPADDKVLEDSTDSPAASPTVATFSHTTPSARASFPSPRHRRQSASDHATAYRDLIGSDSDTFSDEPPHPLLPDQHRASTQSTATSAARSSTDTIVVAAIENAIPAKAYRQATLIQRERSAGGRVRTPSGSYHPYTPDHAVQAERSRAGSLAQLEGGQDTAYPPPQTQPSRVSEGEDLQQQQQQRRSFHQQTDTLESIVGRYDRTLSPVPASDAGSIYETQAQTQPQPPRTQLTKSSHPAPPSSSSSSSPPKPKHQQQQRASVPVPDRYSGGLQYGYERGVGLQQGSSGMRSSVVGPAGGKVQARGRSQLSEMYGLDLGDVPMFLRRG